MTREEAFAVWTPDGSPWSRWTKAVLFSFLPGEIAGVAAPPPPLGWRADLARGTALVVELPGADGVELAVTLARAGYRPIPLYNACPYSPLSDLRRDGATSAVDAVAILRALEDNTATLRSIPLPPAAPPAFLLDADRLGLPTSPPPGWFDNRSILRETDVPSAEFLRGQGMGQVVVVRREGSLPRDLRAVLLRWQEGGLILSAQTPLKRWDPELLVLARPSWLARCWNWCFALFEPRPRSDGSFGRTMPTGG